MPRIGRRWRASSWFCVRACSGSTCRVLRWVAAAKRVGGGSARGRQPVFGPPCTARCWSNFRTPMRSTGRARPSTVRACQRKRGLRDRPEPDGPGQAGDEAPPRRGRQRHAARPDADRGQLQRQPYAGGDPRRGAGRAHRPAWSPAMQTGQAARRQGLRLPSLPGRQPLPARVPGPQHHTTDRSTGHRELPAPRPPSLDRGAHFGLARPLPPTDHPLRATRRPASRIHDPRLCPHLQGTDRPVLSLTLSLLLLVRRMAECQPDHHGAGGAA